MENKELKKTIETLKRIRRNPPKDFQSEELEALSFAFDYLLEDLKELNKK